MNLYRQKQRWKIILVVIAILLVVASLWVSNSIVKKVAQTEKSRVEQWADAVKRKADLVNLTNNAFDQLRDNERKKVEFWTLSMQEINKDLTDYSYVLSILKESSQLPMIITDSKGNIQSDYNLSYLDSFFVEKAQLDSQLPPSDSLIKAWKMDSLQKCIETWPSTHPPLTLNLYKNENQTVYYYDSKKLSDLEKSKDSLFTAFSEELVTNEYLVPVLFLDRKNRDIIATNMPDLDTNQQAISSLVYRLSSENDSILIDLGSEHSGVIYFEHSPELTQLKYFPLVQFFIIGLFVLIGYLVFSTYRKAEQDQVWVGMAKETAHQLGTPISSLMAWVQLLEAQGVEQSTISEMNKDIDRLNTVTNRFSKIGSKAILKTENIVPVVESSVNYLKQRVSSKVSIHFYSKSNHILAKINAPLLEWVIENIVKNAVDAMEGKGQININLTQLENEILIDIEDNGKGIPANKLKTVFQPGYTTKTRGWGLGLSLVKRIVEEFHKGRIYVLKSEVNVGTTFRIILKAEE